MSRSASWEWGGDTILWSSPALAPCLQYLNKCNECNPGEAPGCRPTVPANGNLWCLHSLSSHHKVLQEEGEVREGERVGDGQPSPDIIQILSIKTNNQMQSYSPPALSLSYQSSLPEKTSSVFTYISTSRGISSYLLPQLCISSTKLEYFCWFVSTNL